MLLQDFASQHLDVSTIQIAVFAKLVLQVSVNLFNALQGSNVGTESVFQVVSTHLVQTVPIVDIIADV
jgi:hypothetical protein